MVMANEENLKYFEESKNVISSKKKFVGRNESAGIWSSSPCCRTCVCGISKQVYTCLRAVKEEIVICLFAKHDCLLATCYKDTEYHEV